jgi:hypothetical protein
MAACQRGNTPTERTWQEESSHVESSNSPLRDECLTDCWSTSRSHSGAYAIGPSVTIDRLHHPYSLFGFLDRPLRTREAA